MTVVVDGAPASRVTVDVEPPIATGMRFGAASVSTSMLLALWGFAVLGFLMLVREAFDRCWDIAVFEETDHGRAQGRPPRHWRLAP